MFAKSVRALGLLALGGGFLFAAPPAWWSQEHAILDPTASAENHAPANLGQLKNVAKQAAAYLDQHLPGTEGAGATIHQLIASFEAPLDQEHHTSQQIADSRNGNYAPVNLGQLKAVAKPFYDRLLAVGYDTRQNLIAHQYPNDWNSVYPWATNPVAALADNYAPANLGQLKMVFSFDVSTDSDGDGLPDWWNLVYFGTPQVDPNADPDDDGLTNAQEFAAGTNPSSWDTDADGMPDGWEVSHGLNPLVNDGSADADGDGLTNLEEYLRDTNPNDANDPGAGTPTVYSRSRYKYLPKYGFAEFAYPSTPPKRYLVRRTIDSLLGGNPESLVGGTILDTTDPLTGNVTVTRSFRPQFSATGAAGSPTQWTSNYQVDSYDDPPNQINDEPATAHVESTLSQENTTESHLLPNTRALLPPYPPEFAASLDYGYRDLADEELSFQLGIVEYKFRFERRAPSMRVNWAIEFTPETGAPSRVLETKTWTGANVIETPVYVLDPDTFPASAYGLTAFDPAKHGTERDGTYRIVLLPVDLDIIHPATGELADAKEDVGDGGYVSVRRMVDGQDVTPVTKLVIRAVGGAQSSWKTRLKFAAADRFKIYSDEVRTQEVTSEQTEFTATAETTLYFQGLKKSLSRGGEEIKMQVGLNSQWYDGDSLKCTVVQSEFLFQVKAFIPYAWTEAERILGIDPLFGLVAKGDKRGFLNAYSNKTNKFSAAPFRVCQTVVVTPYAELHSTADIESERHLWTAPLSEHFNKASSVDPSEMSLHYGSISPSGEPAKKGPPPTLREHYWFAQRNTTHTAQVTIEGAGRDGAVVDPLLDPTGASDIHWYLGLKIWADTNPLKPLVQFAGEHDRYPAYEIIVIQSDGTYKDIHRVSPNAGDLPGLDSLDDRNGRKNLNQTYEITN